MPVRAIQALASRGDDAIEFLRIALRVNVEAGLLAAGGACPAEDIFDALD